MTRRRWNWSIERKLPLLFSVLLLAVVLVMLGAAFQQVRHATLSLATARLKTIAKTYLDLLPLDPATRRTQTATMAADPGVREFVTSGGTRGRDWVLAAMRRIAPDTSSTVVLEVWDTAGHRLILRGDSAWQSDGAPVDQLDSAAVGPYRVRHDTLMYVEVQAAVRQGNEGRVIGRVVQVRRAVLSKRVREFMTGIAGGDVTLLLGNADGDPWTDLEHLIPAPPPEARASVEPTVYQRGEPKFGVAGSIPGTPWKFLVELSQQQWRSPTCDAGTRATAHATAVATTRPGTSRASRGSTPRHRTLAHRADRRWARRWHAPRAAEPGSGARGPSKDRRRRCRGAGSRRRRQSPSWIPAL